MAIKKPVPPGVAARKALLERKKAKLRGLKSPAGKKPEVEFSENYRTSQIYSMGFEFAFMSKVKDVWQQICTFVYCKDFLHDLVWAAVNKTKWQIYGFKYDSGKDLPLEQDYCAFAFRNVMQKEKVAEFHAKREACQDFLNQIEKKLGFEPSQIHEVEHKDAPCWLILGDKKWQHAPPLVGLFTLFIRVGVAHTLGNSYTETLEKCRTGKLKIVEGSAAGSNDPTYIKQAWRGIEVVLEHGLGVFHSKMEDNYPLDLPKKTSLHDSLGPVNWTAGHAKDAMPRWYKHF